MKGVEKTYTPSLSKAMANGRSSKPQSCFFARSKMLRFCHPVFPRTIHLGQQTRMNDRSEFKLVSQAATRAPDNPASANAVSSWLLSTFHSALDGMVVADATRRIVMLNQETERMFGYSARRLTGQPLDLLFSILTPIDYWQKIEAHVAANHAANAVPLQFDLQGVRANGEDFPISISLSGLATPDQRFFALVLRERPSTATIATAAGQIATPRLMQTLNASSEQAREVERRRFSRELYDDLGQNLSVLKLDLDWLQSGFPDAGPQFATRVQHMQSVLDNVIVRTKSIASALRPPLLDDFGLVAALQWASERFQKKTAIRCSLQSGEFAARLGEPVESVIFRVVQEGLLNVEKHANASHVNIAVWRSDNRLNLLLRDNGIGLHAHNKARPGCFGLIAMRQRVYALSGKITIENVQPSGLEIQVSIPLEPLADNEVLP